MTRYIIDASVIIETFIRSELALICAAAIADAEWLCAPDIIDLEIMSGLRSAVMRGDIRADDAVAALADVHAMPIYRMQSRDLVAIAWPHHQNATAADSLYLAAAQATGLPFLTVDRPLTRARNWRALGIEVINLRES